MNTLNNRSAGCSGVPLGAALLGWFGLDAVVLVDAATFLVAAALVAPIVVPRAAEATGQDGRRRGWRTRPSPRWRRSGGSGGRGCTWSATTGRSRCSSWCSD